MTLVVRDEADIVEAQLAYHLNAGVDFVIASDHESQDGTTEILESYARHGSLLRIPVQGEMRDGAWRTHMARLAATEYEADWVINTDADEFWMPRRGTLRDVFAAIPDRYGVFWALTRHFVPRPDDGEFFAERMTTRLSAVAPINDPTSPYRPHAKAAHRGNPDIVVGFGSHIARSPALEPLRDWYPADVLHFPFRTQVQYERKGVRRAHGDKPLGQYVRAYQAREEGRVEHLYRTLAVADPTLEKGWAAGTLVVDTRLRDALRALRANGGFRRPPRDVEPQAVSVTGTVEDEVRAIFECAALRDADLVRVQRRLDGLGSRLAYLEQRAWTRAGRTAGR